MAVKKGKRKKKPAKKKFILGEKEQKRLADLRVQVMAQVDLAGEIKDEELLACIDQVLTRDCGKQISSFQEKMFYRRKLFDSFRRLYVLQELVEDSSVTEIMVNGMEAIFLERNGIIGQWDQHFSSQEKLEDVIQQMVSRVNRVVNTSSPIVDARLEDGSRINVVLPPVAPDGPILTIRKFPEEAITMEMLIAWGSLSAEAAGFLSGLVQAGYNIFISGGTSSGKTTFLNALSQYIPAHERVITIEDSLELQVKIKNLVRLEARNANLEGEREVSIRDLIRTALRMRPDRLLVGEVRGPEALDMLQAMNTGHDGSLSTGHGNNPKDMLSRLETMVLMGGELPLAAVRSQIGSALDIMIHLGRQRDGKRRVLSVVEVLGYEEGEIRWQELYRYEEDAGKGALVSVGTLQNRKKWRAAGLPPL